MVTLEHTVYLAPHLTLYSEKSLLEKAHYKNCYQYPPNPQNYQLVFKVPCCNFPKKYKKFRYHVNNVWMAFMFCLPALCSKAGDSIVTGLILEPTLWNNLRLQIIRCQLFSIFTYAPDWEVFQHILNVQSVHVIYSFFYTHVSTANCNMKLIAILS